MANFILLHGAWHWGGCFQKVAVELALRGHHVVAPDLACAGFDPTPAEDVGDIAAYTASARRLIEAADEKVILLGHSMGGVSVTYLGEQLADKIAAVVYLAAFMVADGKTPVDYLSGTPGIVDENTSGILKLITAVPTGLRFDTADTAGLKAAFYHDCSEHDFAVARKNLLDVQPVAGTFNPAVITPDRFGKLRRVYIECTQDQAISIAAQRQMQADQPGTEVLSMDSSHSPFFSQPERLAELLAGLAPD